MSALVEPQPHTVRTAKPHERAIAENWGYLDLEWDDLLPGEIAVERTEAEE